jgi:hypothetical protein
MQKEAVVAYLMYYLSVRGKIEENHVNGLDRLFPGRDSNSVHLKYKAMVPMTQA